MAGLAPAIHVFPLFSIARTWMPGTSGAKTRFCPGMTPFSSLADSWLAEKLPIDPVPVQCGNDARPDPVAHAVRSRAPRHQRSSLGRRSSGSGTRGPGSVPLHPGRPGPGPLGVARLGFARLRLDRLGFGLDRRRSFDIFRNFRSRRCFHDSRSLRCLCRSGHRRGLAAERKAPITRLRGGGNQSKSCNQNEFTHVEISP